MNRHLIWIIAGTSVLGLGVPAFAAARSDGASDVNVVRGEVRGHCDEAEHATDPNCLPVVVPGPTMRPVVVPVPSTTPVALASNTNARDTIGGDPVAGRNVSVPSAVKDTVDGEHDSSTHDASDDGINDDLADDASDDGVNDDLADDSSTHDASDDGVNDDLADDGVDHDLADDSSTHDASDDGVNHAVDVHDGSDDGQSGHGGGED